MRVGHTAGGSNDWGWSHGGGRRGWTAESGAVMGDWYWAAGSGPVVVWFDNGEVAGGALSPRVMVGDGWSAVEVRWAVREKITLFLKEGKFVTSHTLVTPLSNLVTPFSNPVNFYRISFCLYLVIHHQLPHNSK